MKKKYPKVLTIAGSDSGGGAGIQADLKTISALGCYGTSAITAITVQNTLGVSGIHSVPVDIVGKQIDAVLSDIGTDAIKIGMLHTPDIVKIVTSMIGKYKIGDVVLDPVMVATSGDKLIEDDTIGVLMKALFPLSRVITPNLDEAQIILGKQINGREEMLAGAVELLKYGSFGVLLKGGHLNSDTLTDVYFDKSMTEPVIFEKTKIVTHNVHGTGCTLSSALASYMAQGYDLLPAVENALEYVYRAIENGNDYQTGQGNGPVNHFFNPFKLK